MNILTMWMYSTVDTDEKHDKTEFILTLSLNENKFKWFFDSLIVYGSVFETLFIIN